MKFYESWGARAGFSFVPFIDVLTKPYNTFFLSSEGIS